MATFHFDLVAPDQLVFSGEVEQVDVPGAEGDFGVLAGHAPLVAMLKPGVLVVHGGGQQQRIVVTGGFAEVNPLGLTILADTATPVDHFDTAALAEAVAATEEQAAAAAGRAKDKLQERAEQLKALRSLLGAAGTAH